MEEQSGPPDIQTIINILESTQNNDPQIREPACAAYEKFPPESIPILFQIFQTDVGRVVKTLILQKIILLINPTTFHSYQVIASFLKENQMYSEIIYKLVQAALFNQELVIRNLGSKLYSLLIGFKKDEMLQDLSEFAALMESKTQEPIISMVFIDTFMNIFQLNNFNLHIKNDRFFPIFARVFLFCQNEIISAGQGLPLDLVLSSCKYISRFLKIFTEESNKPDIIMNLLNSFPGSLLTGDFKIIRKIHRIMLLIVRLIYEHSNDFFPSIFENVMNTIQKFGDNPQIHQVFLNFWMDLAKYELSLENPFQELCKKSFNDISTILFSFVDQWKLNKQLLDELFEFDSEIDPYIDSLSETIDLFSRIDHPTVFQAVVANIEEKKANLNEDNLCLIFILFISVTNEVQSPESVEYLFTNSQSILIPNLMNTTPPDIRFLAFLLMNRIIKYYMNAFYSSREFDSKLEFAIGLIELMTFTEPDDSPTPIKLISCYLIILTTLSEITIDSPRLFVNICEKIKEKLDEIISIIFTTFDFSFLILVQKALWTVIDRMTSVSTTISQTIESWFYQLLELLKSTPSILDSNARMPIQYTLCLAISKLIPKVDDHASLQAVPYLIGCIQLGNKVFDEASEGIRNIIQTKPELFQPEQMLEIFNICIQALKSQEMTTINSSCILIYYIFKQYFDLVKDSLSAVISELVMLFANGKDLIRSHKFILKTIGDLLLFKKDIESFEIDPQLEEVLGNLLKDTVSTPLDFKQYEYVNDLYFGICSLYDGYMMNFKEDLKNISPIDPEKLKKESLQISLLKSIALNIRKIPKIYDNTLKQFFFDLSNIAKKCSTANNLIMKNRIFQSIIQDALDNRPSLAIFARDAKSWTSNC